MNLTFQINYLTEYGQQLCIIETEASVLGYSEQHPLILSCQGQDFWIATINPEAGLKRLHYRYAVLLQDGTYLYESGQARIIDLPARSRQVVVRDFWQQDDHETPFYTTAFMQALFRRTNTIAASCTSGQIHFSISLPQILPGQGVAVMGNIPELGNWDPEHKLLLSDSTFSCWQGWVSARNVQIVEYKYCIYDLQSGRVIDLEWGENRHIWGIRSGQTILQNDRSFRRTQPRWKGAGVAIPVFSLRTEEGFGIGEFLDIKKLADWAAEVGMKMIQTLPINDTTLTHTNLDSYPYNAVSVFALHPIYINIPRMGKLSAVKLKQYNTQREQLNSGTIADYQRVYDLKMQYFLLLFRNHKATDLASPEYQAFFAKNREWLEPYATFLHRRDKHPVEFYYYLQFHADRQLSEAVLYAHSRGVAIKGDIPIGISPDSVDAAIHPELFHLDASAGAPPDDFDARGQNWGFPTYNWDQMAHDHYAWWQHRFRKMQDYFDAYRIDHILGFFRIWQMRKSDVWGLCGHFSPAMPYSVQDLWDMGIKLDEDRMVKPYIRSNFLGQVFGYDTEEAKQKFLRTHDGYVYFFRDEFDSQRKVENYFLSHNLTDEHSTNLMNGLLYLHTEVLFVRDQTHPELLHPRITVYQSHSFSELYDDQREVIMRIYNDYFFHRHTQFWRDSALRKLPTLIHSTGMLCCGEDLGMVPSCVPEVMHDLHILSLEIQRMPKDPNRLFAHPADAPYLSVCTTGTHDTNPLRAWWLEDRQKTQRYYNEQLGWPGEAPQQLTPEVAEAILIQHMYSPAMWVILPMQDWLAIDGQLRLSDCQAERINVPSNPRHFWCYRMHLSLEQLLHSDEFNAHVRRLTAIR